MSIEKSDAWLQGPERLASVVTTPLQANNFYELQAEKLDGSNLRFDRLRGKMVLIVNAACGSEGSVKELQQLRRIAAKFGDFLRVIIFPCNQFNQVLAYSNVLQMICSR